MKGLGVRGGKLASVRLGDDGAPTMDTILRVLHYRGASELALIHTEGFAPLQSIMISTIALLHQLKCP